MKSRSKRSSLKRRQRQQESLRRSMQVENLEERRLLTVTSAVFDTPFTSLVEDPANAAAVTANQPYITVITSGTSAAGPADTIFLAQTPAPATDAESSDFSLDNVVLPVGLPAGNYTIGLIDNSIIDNNTCLLYTSPSPRDQRGSRMPSSA